MSNALPLEILAPAPQPDHALRACAGALRAARRIERINDEWRAQGRPEFRIRIGLNSADVLVGNVGSSERLSYTVMGDGVNVAARLEGMNKAFGTTVCISDSTVNALGSSLLVRPLRRVQVKGRTHEFMIYELLGLNGSSDPELQAGDAEVRLSKMTWEASGLFRTWRVCARLVTIKRYWMHFLKIPLPSRCGQPAEPLQ